MNFTREIKRDLMRRAPSKPCCAFSLLSAAFAASGALSESGFSFTSENEESARYLLGLVEQWCGVRMFLTEAAYDPKHGRDKLTFSYTGEGGGEAARALALSREEPKDCCAENFLKGGFLGGGSCTLPRAGTKTGYHLEVVLPAEAAERYLSLLERFQILGSALTRGERVVVYFKSREAISDFLSAVGANSALRTLNEVSARRQESNDENRVSNCLAGNADRAAIASVEQVRAISALMQTDRFKTLPAPLREVAEARLTHPELSLGELAEAIGLTKSGLYHRLRKLMEICRKG